MPWGIDLVPGVNVGNLWNQITDPGGDYDVLDNRSFDGGVRDAAPGRYVNNVYTTQGKNKPGYDSTGRLISTNNNNQLKNTSKNDNNSGGSGGGGGGGGGFGGYTGPSFDPNVLGQFDTAIDTTQSALGRLGKQLGIARGNINSQYGTNLNELNTAKQRAQNSYNTSSTQNQQSYRGDKNQIADTASSGLRGLLRTLGAYGAGGSSDAMYVAPQAVAMQASQQRAGAGENFAQNQQNLDTNWNNYQEEDKNDRRKLTDWRTQQLNNAEAQSNTTKQSLLSKLADLMGQRAAYQGGDYGRSAQPYIDQANALSGRIDDLARINPTYNGKTPVYNAPTLDSYAVDNDATVGAQNAAQSAATPFLSLLLGNQRDKNQLGL